MMYVFNRNGVCLVCREWSRPLRTLSSQQNHEFLIVRTKIFSLKSFTAKMDPSRHYIHNLHHLYKFRLKILFISIVVTIPKTGDLRESLKHIYRLYVEYVVKNMYSGIVTSCFRFNDFLVYRTDYYMRVVMPYSC
ncbi:hypothetical protein MKW94_022634 [Papaver nudicaule]|uniref:Trafficking protein particle complex subunit n=1 Tax=Papaver nudicaule TaxID=74823 RepID=A0AA41SJG5_PAPNU|nr:hypothetical protein [Papaver nudicaule]